MYISINIYKIISINYCKFNLLMYKYLDIGNSTYTKKILIFYI